MVLWNNKDLKEFGIIVESVPPIPKAERSFTKYEVPGRSGSLFIDNGTYKTKTYSLSCHFHKNADIDKIKSFLDGYGTLSIDGKTEYAGIIDGSISFEKVLMFRKFLIQFCLNPIGEDIDYTTYKVIKNDFEINIAKATANMYPILKITATGNITVTVNNMAFNLKDADGEYILDCKNKVITKNGVNASYQMQNDFPYLVPLKNHILYTGNVSSFEIKYKKAYL